MEWNQDAIDAARATLQTVNNAVDAIATKAAQLESLFVLLAHCVSAGDFPTQHHENICFLGAELAAAVRDAVALLT